MGYRSGAPRTVPVVLVAQVVNGLLLPVRGSMLERAPMLPECSKKVISTPQPLLRSAAFVFSFATTVFLGGRRPQQRVVSASVASRGLRAGDAGDGWGRGSAVVDAEGALEEQAEFELAGELPVPNPLRRVARLAVSY